MKPIISIVGKSKSGKTTLIENLVPELKRRGYRVGTIKHDVHGFQLDREGKDTWRHAQAGVDTVVISSPQKVACIKKVDEELTIDELVCQFLPDVDIVLTEGYKRQDKPKIEVFRSELSGEPLCVDDDTLLAIVSDAKTQIDAPHFHPRDVDRLADFIMEQFSDEIYQQKIQLYVNGREIPLTKRFTRDILSNTILGMISALSGTEDAQKIRIFVSQ